MAAQKKVKLPRVVTPVGTLVYVWADKPDDKFATETVPAKYKASIILDPATPGVEEFMKDLKAKGIAAAAALDVELEEGFKFAKSTPKDKGTKKKPIKEEFQGMYVLEAKTGADYPPRRKDAANNLIEEDGVIRSGDIGRLALTVSAYEAFGSGISLRLNAIQLIEKRATGGAGDDDFDDHAGGYVHGSKASSDTESDDDDEAEDNDDF
jgi:hypothetical protein